MPDTPKRCPECLELYVEWDDPQDGIAPCSICKDILANMEEYEDYQLYEELASYGVDEDDALPDDG